MSIDLPTEEWDLIAQAICRANGAVCACSRDARACSRGGERCKEALLEAIAAVEIYEKIRWRTDDRMRPSRK